MVVENVRGAQKWVGRARWNAGSFYFWGDVPALMPTFKAVKVSGLNWSGSDKPGYRAVAFNSTAVRNAGLPAGVRPHSLAWGNETRWFNDGPRSPDSLASSSSSSPRRKFASAMIAKIPLVISRHIARVYYP